MEFTTEPTIEVMQDAIALQAISKGWRMDSIYCLKRLIKEALELWDELDKADRDPEKISFECIDVLYFLLQIQKTAAPKVNIIKAFEKKYADNWKQLKKTEDSKGNQIRK